MFSDIPRDSYNTCHILFLLSVYGLTYLKVGGMVVELHARSLPRHWSQFEAAFSTALHVKQSCSRWQKYDILTESRDTSSCVLLQPKQDLILSFLAFWQFSQAPSALFLSFPYHTGEARVPRGAPQRHPPPFGARLKWSCSDGAPRPPRNLQRSFQQLLYLFLRATSESGKKTYW